MLMVLWVLAAITFAMAILPVLAALRFRAYVKREERRSRSDFAPPVTVVLPCKGVDPGFDDNVRSILHQDYPDYEVVFVVAAKEDPAFRRLRELAEETTGVDTKLVVAGVREGRSQKLNNQLHALRRTRASSEAYVFVDSDVRAHPTFLRDIVAPLCSDDVGATTGFRWYVPKEGGLGSYIRAAWNGGGLPLLTDPKSACAWGGAMGILRKTFQEAGIRERWANALTDDFPLTLAVRELGLQVKFVPQCLVASYEDCSLSQVVEWTNRQTIICRVYDPPLWCVIFSFHAVHALSLCAAIGIVVYELTIVGGGPAIWPALVMLAAVLLNMTPLAIEWSAVRRHLPDIGGWRQALRHIALAPAAILLIFMNSVWSLTTHDICWRGVRYRLHAPDRIEVLSVPGADQA